MRARQQPEQSRPLLGSASQPPSQGESIRRRRAEQQRTCEAGVLVPPVGVVREGDVSVLYIAAVSKQGNGWAPLNLIKLWLFDAREVRSLNVGVQVRDLPWEVAERVQQGQDCVGDLPFACRGQHRWLAAADIERLCS